MNSKTNEPTAGPADSQNFNEYCTYNDNARVSRVCLIAMAS